MGNIPTMSPSWTKFSRSAEEEIAFIMPADNNTNFGVMDMKQDQKAMHKLIQQPTNHILENHNLLTWKASNIIDTFFGGKVVFSCFLYSFCGVSMVLVNKSLASSYNHLITGDLNILLVIFQAIVAVVCVEFCKHMKIMDHYTLDWAIIKMWIPVNLFFCGMLFTGMASLQHNTVPMVTVFKNVANIVTAAGDWYFFGSVPGSLVFVAFAVMLGGACFAAVNDVQITAIGIFWMVANCVFTAGYVLYMRFATKNVKLSKFGMVFYNNLLCICLLVPVAYGRGEIASFLNSKAIHTLDYFIKNVSAGFVGFFLNFASLSCVAATGPTTFAILGSLNKIPITFLGYFMFDTVITPQTWFFIAVSMLGGFIYSYAKINGEKGDFGRQQGRTDGSQPHRHCVLTGFDMMGGFLKGSFLRTSIHRVLFICAIYQSSSILSSLATENMNKSFSAMAKNDVLVLSYVFQSSLVIAGVRIGRRVNAFHPFRVTSESLKLWAPVSVLFVAMMGTTVFALQHVTFPLIMVVKCLTNIIVSDCDHYIFGTSTTKLASASLGIMLVGACLAAFNDLQVSRTGLCWAAANCVASAAYVLHLNFVTKNGGLSMIGMVYHQNLLSMMLLLPVVLMKGEIGSFVSSTSLHTSGYFFMTCMASLAGILVQVAGLNCIIHTGPTTLSVLGTLNSILTVVIGACLFGHRIPSDIWRFVIVSSIAGGVFFCSRLSDATVLEENSRAQLSTETNTSSGSLINIMNDAKSMHHEWQLGTTVASSFDIEAAARFPVKAEAIFGPNKVIAT